MNLHDSLLKLENTSLNALPNKTFYKYILVFFTSLQMWLLKFIYSIVTTDAKKHLHTGLWKFALLKDLLQKQFVTQDQNIFFLKNPDLSRCHYFMNSPINGFIYWFCLRQIFKLQDLPANKKEKRFLWGLYPSIRV